MVQTEIHIDQNNKICFFLLFEFLPSSWSNLGQFYRFANLPSFSIAKSARMFFFLYSTLNVLLDHFQVFLKGCPCAVRLTPSDTVMN